MRRSVRSAWLVLTMAVALACQPAAVPTAAVPTAAIPTAVGSPTSRSTATTASATSSPTASAPADPSTAPVATATISATATATSTPTPMPEPTATATPAATPGPAAGLVEPFPRDGFHRPTTIDNPWLPLTPGVRRVYKGLSGVGVDRLPHQISFTVTDLTKVVDGVPTLVVYEEDHSDGELVEAELIFYAQDDTGRVWLMGEYPEEIEEGKIVGTPAWLSGVHGAAAGILMQAEPRYDTPSYSEGWGPEVGWTDRARVLETGSKTCVPYRCFEDVLVIDEYNPDTPDAHQLKYYAHGIGNVRVGWAGFLDDTEETLGLTEVTQLDAAGVAAFRTTAFAMEQRAYERSPLVYGTTQPLEPLPPQ